MTTRLVGSVERDIDNVEVVLHLEEKEIANGDYFPRVYFWLIGDVKALPCMLNPRKRDN